MTSKEYLEQVWRIDQHIDSKLEQLATQRALAAKASVALSEIPFARNRNMQGMEAVIVKIVDLENEINAEIDALVDLKREVMAVIRSVENEEYRLLLELRYLCFCKWKQIAAKMGYSVQHTFRLHENALKKITISRTGE